MGGFVEDYFVARLSENLKSCQATSGCYSDTNESVSQNVKLLLGEIKTVIVAHNKSRLCNLFQCHSGTRKVVR